MHHMPCKPRRSWIGLPVWDFPICTEPVDNTYITILSPVYHDHELINQKGYFLIVPEPVMDHCNHFAHVNTGYFARVQNARMFRSLFLRELMSGESLPYSQIKGNYTPTTNQRPCLSTAPQADEAIHGTSGFLEGSIHLQVQRLQDSCEVCFSVWVSQDSLEVLEDMHGCQ